MSANLDAYYGFKRVKAVKILIFGLFSFMQFALTLNTVNFRSNNSVLETLTTELKIVYFMKKIKIQKILAQSGPDTGLIWSLGCVSPRRPHKSCVAKVGFLVLATDQTTTTLVALILMGTQKASYLVWKCLRGTSVH